MAQKYVGLGWLVLKKQNYDVFFSTRFYDISHCAHCTHDQNAWST